MSTAELDVRTPDEIERSIEARRESLKGKLNELEHRLSPGERIREMRRRIDPEAMVPWAAVGAVATGAVLAIRGLRRSRSAHTEAAADEDTFCIVDVDVPPGVVA